MGKRKPAASATQHKAEVGDRLRRVLRAMGMQNKAWAETYGCSENQLSNWLHGDNYPDIPVLIKFCDEQGLTLDWFFRGVESGVLFSWVERLREPKLASSAASQGQERPVHGKV